MRTIIKLCLISCLSFCAYANSGFDVLVLGEYGGVKEGNLTAYLISPEGSDSAVMCDVGTLVNGLDVSLSQGTANYLLTNMKNTDSAKSHILKNVIKGYMITHAHLDHINGLVLASPSDNEKQIYATSNTLAMLSQHMFNWAIWPNFANTGSAPQLGLYDYIETPFYTPIQVKRSEMQVTAFPLSHSGVTSTAFLISYKEKSILCMGDTGPDQVEKSDSLAQLWQSVAPLIQREQLLGIIIECSYDNSRADKLLFGHLTPSWLLRELHALAEQVNDVEKMRKLTILVGHIKYPLDERKDMHALLKTQLASDNALKLNIQLVRQGQHVKL